MTGYRFKGGGSNMIRRERKYDGKWKGWGHDRIRIGWGAWPNMDWRGGSMT